MKGRRNKGQGTRGFIFLLPFSLFPCASPAQAPDVRAHIDLSASIDYPRGSGRSARLYSPLGRPSIAALSLALETGYNLYIAERLQRLPGDADGDLFDEAYVEDPGILRVGKQYLPFGTGRLLRESATAFRIDSNLIAERAPVSFVYCDAGEGRQRGVVARVGRSVGASLAVGDHFGIAATSLGVVRHPDDAPGRDGGWARAFGFDATRRFGKLGLSGDFVLLGGGPQRSTSVLDLEATYASDGYRTIGFGYSATDGAGFGFLRLFGRVHAARNLDVEPLLRLKDGALFDAAVTLRLRL